VTGATTLRRILVVDDEMLIRWSISETLKPHGYTVVEAADAASARRALAEAPEPPDAVVLDYRLPDSNDLSLLADMRRTIPNTPIVLITAFGTHDISDRATTLGAYAVLNKPFEMGDLEATLSRACHPTPR
jgi:two-component system response regulator AtoC